MKLSSKSDSDLFLRESLMSVVVLFILAACVVVYFHQTYPDFRASIVFAKDIFIGFLTLLGVGVAAISLVRSAESATTAVSVARTNTTLRFLERWNDPAMAQLKGKWHVLYEELKTKPKPEIAAYLAGCYEKRITISDVFSFFEEFAFAVNSAAADSTIAKQLLGDTILDYYLRLLPWVAEKRKTRADAWTEIDQMLKGWYGPELKSLHISD